MPLMPLTTTTAWILCVCVCVWVGGGGGTKKVYKEGNHSQKTKNPINLYFTLFPQDSYRPTTLTVRKPLLSNYTEFLNPK